MEIFVSAGEVSSDCHCADVIRTLQAKADISTFGLGGKELERTGTEFLLRNENLTGGGGPMEVISQIPIRAKLKRDLRERLARRRPAGALLVDTGEINLKLAPILHRFGVPTVYFVPPKIWVWRSHRIGVLADNVDLVLNILPFEVPIYRARGIPCEYVGHPILDQVPLNLTQADAKAKLGIDPAQPVLTMLPGSRHNEIRFQLDLFAEAVKHFVGRLSGSEEPPLILVPAAYAMDAGQIEEALRSRLPRSAIKVVAQQSHACMKAARAALIKSGTSTLEAALLQVPMVLAYRASRSAEWIFRNVVHYRGFVGLVNLFLERDQEAALGMHGKRAEPVVPEMILQRCQPDLIAEQLLGIYRDGPRRERMLQALSRTAPLLLPPAHLGTSPIRAAADAAWRVFTGGQTRSRTSAIPVAS